MFVWLQLKLKLGPTLCYTEGAPVQSFSGRKIYTQLYDLYVQNVATLCAIVCTTPLCIQTYILTYIG